MVRKTLAVLLALSVCVGCPSASTLTKTGQARKPRAPDCHFSMLTLPPNGGYLEVGTLDMQWLYYRDLQEFRDAIRPKVCEAGGDAVIAHANGKGQYIKATIIRRASFGPGRASAARKDSHPAEKVAAPSGCQYDTQCKGERVCIKGECVAPEPATSATQ